MFENILNQSATKLLQDDIEKKRFPNSILFSGPSSSGKLSCALETARVLSCANSGEWNCTCLNCRQPASIPAAKAAAEPGTGRRSNPPQPRR